jgi:hypothetical protein
MEEPMADSTVVLYRAPEAERISRAASARTKQTFRIGSEGELADRTRGRLASSAVDASGSFSVTLDEKADEYFGGAVVVAVRIPDPAGRDDVEPVHATVTVVQPDWVEGEEGMVAEWDECLTESQWCRVLEAVDAWMVCGQVTTCADEEEPTVPVPDLTVTAFDADIVQRDELGSDTTDSGGWYSIYYSRADFEETPAPFMPIELRGGPDLFFRVASSGGSTLIDEEPSDGREPGREDVGHCAHVDLCVDFTPGDGGDTIPTAWTRVGTAFDVDADFDDDGYAGSLKWGLTGTLKMTGSTPRSTAAGDDVEYRFLVSTTTAPNSDPPLSAGAFTAAVGDQNNPNLLAQGVEVGMLVRFTPSGLERYSVRATRDDMDSSGWFNVNDAIQRTFADEGIPPSARGSFSWLDTDTLLGIDTGHLTTESDVPAGAARAGDDIDPADEIDVETVSFRFEARAVTPSGGISYLPAHGQTLNRAVVDNTSVFRALELPQQASGACDPISTDDVDLAYTIHHPHLRDAEIQLKPNNAGWNDLEDTETGSDVDSEVSFYSSTLSGAQLKSMQHTHYNAEFDIADEVPEECSYIVELRTRKRLHTGSSAASWSRLPPISFWAE